MKRCEKCFGEYDERIAAGVCPHCGYMQGEQQDDPRYLPIGCMLHDRYIIGGVVGAGGFGITYKAWDAKYNVCKAIKEYFQQGVVNRIPGDTEVFVSAPKRQEEFEYGKERLLEEARIVAKFQSSSIVRVDDFFEENGTSYMVMEFLDYETLEDYLIRQKRPLTEDEAVRIGVRLCEALDEIHHAGVVHRDISPDNIFVSKEGGVKIIDFGSARLSKEDTDSRLIVLKPGYAPPEQYEKIDPNNDLQQAWTDIYALGATLYVVVTGKVPAESTDRKADFDAHTDRVCYPKEINQNIPEYLSNTIMTAMAINIHERFQNAAQMKEALMQKRKVLPVEAVRKKKKARRTAGIAAGIAVVLLLVGIFAGNLTKNKKEIVLDPATISVWYSLSSDEGLAAEKTNALQSIYDALYDGDQFANVKIEMRGIDENSYRQELDKAYDAGRMPTVFESVQSDDECMKAAQSLKELADMPGTNDCQFQAAFEKYIQTGTQMPMAFNVPVVYINTEVVTDSADLKSIAGMNELLALCGGEMKYKPMSVQNGLKAVYSEVFPEFSSYDGKMSSEKEFMEGQTAICFGDTSIYFQIRDVLPGKFSMLTLNVGSIPCQYANCWSMTASEGAEKVAAETFLAYLISNNAQDIYYLQGGNPGLPMNAAALDGYDDVRKQFAQVVADCGRYTFQ